MNNAAKLLLPPWQQMNMSCVLIDSMDRCMGLVTPELSFLSLSPPTAQGFPGAYKLSRACIPGPESVGAFCVHMPLQAPHSPMFWSQI